MGTYRKEWDCCDSVTETESREPEDCPFCVGLSPAGPPNREWLGLTHEEVEEVEGQCWTRGGLGAQFQRHLFARKLEAKLREKNSVAQK
jgi:hypothetical protein